jgi:glutaredoxin
MVSVTLYTRVGCHLCDVVKAQLDAAQSQRRFALEVVDVDTRPELVAQYGDEVPVVMVAGRKAFKYRLNPAEFLERLARAEAAS